MAIADVYEIRVGNGFDCFAGDDRVFVSFQLFNLFGRQLVDGVLGLGYDSQSGRRVRWCVFLWLGNHPAQ
jgi:hypothetical protein